MLNSCQCFKDVCNRGNTHLQNVNTYQHVQHNIPADLNLKPTISLMCVCISTYPRRAITTPEMYAISPGSVLVEVSISAWQYGHIIWVGCGPTGTTVVTIVGPPDTACKHFDYFVLIILLQKCSTVNNELSRRCRNECKYNVLQFTSLLQCSASKPHENVPGLWLEWVDAQNMLMS